MITLLCKFLRPFCVASTLLMMFLIITWFWGKELLSGEILLRLIVSYVVLMIGSFIVFYIEDPQSLVRRRGKQTDTGS